LVTVEGALNQMWDVKKARPLPRRLGLYLLMRGRWATPSPPELP